MQNIKTQLKELIDETMIPETMDYIEELKVLKNNGKATQDDLNAIEEMQFFLEELESVVTAIEEDKITDEESQEIFNKIETMISEHSEH